MFRVLVGSQPARGGWLGSSTVSTVTHGALIALAVASSGVSSTNVTETRAATTERVTYVETTPLPELPREAPVTEARGASPAARVAAKTRAPAQPRALSAPDLSSVERALSAPLTIPDMAAPDLTAVTNGWVADADSTFTSTRSVLDVVMSKAAVSTPANGVFTEDMVERAVEPRSGNPKPRYPAVLADMGVEGDFMVKFVVDSTGTVDEHQMEFPQAMHRLFVDAVKLALHKSRYLPAMIAGRAVPELVVQEFRFSVPGR